MGFMLTRANELSLRDLAVLHQAGTSVMRTAHAGNIYPANLAVAAMGIPMVLHDRVNGMKDLASHPHLMIENGQSLKIGDQSCMVLRAKTIPQVCPSGCTLGEEHAAALRLALPQAEVQTMTDYLENHQELAWSILEEVGKMSPKHFYRYMDADGRISKSLPLGEALDWVELSQNVYGFTNLNEGWIPGNVAYILLCAIIESVRTGEPFVYHTSGVDMDGYMDSLLSELNLLYCHLHKRGIAPFETLDFRLVTITSMRFCGPDATASARKELFEKLVAYKAFEASVGARIQAVPKNQRRTVVEAIDEERRPRQRLIMEIRSECPGFDYDPATPTFFSQYDVPTRGFCLVEEAAATSFADLATLNTMMGRFDP